MEDTTNQNIKNSQNYQLEFFGKGSEYFGIMIVNWLFTLFTLGLYYPWAKAKKLRYIYRQTSLNNERFHFSGTGIEMFRGFVIVYLLYILLIAGLTYVQLLNVSPTLIQASVVGIYLVLIAIIPIAIHGSLKYKMSRTSYRSIRFGYRGDRQEFAVNFYKWTFLTIITLGIYAAWMAMNIRKYIHKNIRYGNVEFANNASGKAFFLILLKGYFLSIITLGIYMFWFSKDLFNYYVNNMEMNKGDQKIKCHSTATGGNFFSLIMVNLLQIVFTFGLGAAWVDMRTHNFIFKHIKMEGNIALDDIQQTEDAYKNATGEQALDFLDIDI